MWGACLPLRGLEWNGVYKRGMCRIDESPTFCVAWSGMECTRGECVANHQHMSDGQPEYNHRADNITKHSSTVLVKDLMGGGGYW